jgi:diguanylate cyclase (GGDEF)-like protein
MRKETEAALRESEEALRLLAITDSLTGLYNRRHFNRLAADEIRRIIRYNRPMSVIMFDIDYFKRINDTYGHLIGDEVLKELAAVTKNFLRPTDISARYGGEEFILLLPETSMERAVVAAERLRAQIDNTSIQTEKETIRITCSFGLSGYGGEDGSQSPEAILTKLVANADQALYVSKNAGRNRVSVYEQRCCPQAEHANRSAS